MAAGSFFESRRGSRKPGGRSMMGKENELFNHFLRDDKKD